MNTHDRDDDRDRGPLPRSQAEYHVYVHQDQPSDVLNHILKLLGVIKTQGEKILADITLTKAALEALNTTTNTLADVVSTVVAADQAEDDAFRAEIQDLKDQIAAGTAVTQADLDALTAGMGGTKATLEALQAALLAIGSTPSNPIPPVDIPPVVPPV